MANTPRTTPCNCLEKIDAELKPKGVMLHQTLGFGRPSRPLISLVRLDTWKPETRRGRPSTFFPTFCPFCGQRYEPEVP